MTSNEKNVQDEQGVLYLMIAVALIFLLVAGIPLITAFLFWKWLPWEVSLILIGGGLSAACFVCGNYWEKNVVQNPELTTTFVRNPDGTMNPVTKPGPIYKRPGAVVEGNQFSQTVKSLNFDFKVNRGNTSVIVKATIRYFFTDGNGMTDEHKKRIFEVQNRLGVTMDDIIKSTIQSFLEKSGDMVVANDVVAANNGAVQEDRFKTIRDILNRRGEFLQAVEDHFRVNHESSLQENLGIEILDETQEGIGLNLSVPKEVEAEMLKLFQQEQQAELIMEKARQLMQLAKDIGQPLLLSEALDQAAAIISGKIQRITGKGARSATTFIPGGGNDGN